MSSRTKRILLAFAPLLIVAGFFSGITLHQGEKLIEASVDVNVRQTLVAILITFLVSFSITVSTLVLFYLHEHRLADRNLKELGQRAVQHQEEERRRVSRELHDGINQLLVSVKYRLEMAMILETSKPVQESLKKGKEGLNQAINEVRRISHDLRPSVLDDIGLLAALHHLLGDFRERNSILTYVDIPPPQNEISKEVATAIYRISQEALLNIEKHANASRVTISLEENAEGLVLRISDNGLGINKKDAHSRDGIGLRNMRERVEFLGGKFYVSPAEISGTVIVASFYPTPSKAKS